MKKTLVSILAIAMIVMLAACGKKEEPAPSANKDITQTADDTKDTEPTKAAEPTAEPNPTDEPTKPTTEPSQPDVTINRSEGEISALTGIWVTDGSYYIINEDGEMTYYTREAETEDTEVGTYRIVFASGDFDAMYFR